MVYSIGNKGGKRWNRGPKRQPSEGGVEGSAEGQQQQERPPRSLRQFRGPRRDGQTQAGSGPQHDRPRHRDSQGRPGSAKPRSVSPRQWTEEGVASVESQEAKQETVKPAPKPLSSKLQPKVELGDVSDLFGPPVAQTSSPVASVSLKNITPSQARVQLLLEKTAGDYSRYAPRPFPTTDVGKLGPLKLAEFSLTHHREVPPKRRTDALTIVEKFTGKGGPQVSV